MPASPARRLFLALMPDDEVRASLLAQADRWHWPDTARRTKPGNLHLTLHFLGHVQPDHEQALLQALPKVAMEPLELVLGTPHFFGGSIAVLLAQPHPGLLALHGRLAPAIQCIGQRLDDPWVPHVTLARKASAARPPEKMPAIRWQVREFALVWSKLTHPTGYQVLHRYPA